jgi:hypothetical protein
MIERRNHLVHGEWPSDREAVHFGHLR